MYQTYAICYSILTILARYRQAMAYGLLFFYSSFSLLSLHFIHFSCLSFFLRHQAPFFSSFTLFSSQSRCFSLFLSDITLSFFFSLFSSFTPISVVVVFFFFFSFLGQWFDTNWFGSGWVEMVIGGSLVVGCDGQIQWWVAATVGGCVGCDSDGFCCAKSIVGGPACEWVPKYGSAVGGLAATVGECVGWVSQWVASVMFWFWSFFFFFFFC